MFALIITIYIAVSTGFTQFYKLTVRTMKNAPAQTVGIQLIAGLACMFFVPFFDFSLPSNPWTYILLVASSALYAINNVILVNVRKNLEASVIDILKQSYTVLMALAGFVLYGEQATPFKIIGIILIITGNILVFWERKRTKRTKYVLIGFFAYVLSVIAGLIGVNHSGEFSLPFYVAFL